GSGREEMFVREMQFRLARGVPFCEIVQATAVQCLTLKTVTQMHLSLVFWIAIAVFVCYQIWIRNRDGAIVHAIRTTKAINAVMAAYRGGDYRTALHSTTESGKPEGWFLKHGRVLLFSRFNAASSWKAR